MYTCKILVFAFFSAFLGHLLLKTSSSKVTSSIKRKSKGPKTWGDDFKPYEAVNEDDHDDNDHDDCSCECEKKKSKTMAIVIPKYKFVDVPMAKEVPHKEYKASKKVVLKSPHDHDDDDDDNGYDEDDEHNHQILDSMYMKRSEKIKELSTTPKSSPFKLFKG